jgi:hypothetical protein
VHERGIFLLADTPTWGCILFYFWFVSLHQWSRHIQRGTCTRFSYSSFLTLYATLGCTYTRERERRDNRIHRLCAGFKAHISPWRTRTCIMYARDRLSIYRVWSRYVHNRWPNAYDSVGQRSSLVFSYLHKGRYDYLPLLWWVTSQYLKYIVHGS